MSDNNTSPVKNWVLPVGLALFSLAVSAYTSYSNNDKAIAVQVSTLENQQKYNDETLKRIEMKIDRLDAKTDAGLESLRTQLNQQRRDGWYYVPPAKK